MNLCLEAAEEKTSSCDTQSVAIQQHEKKNETLHTVQSLAVTRGLAQSVLENSQLQMRTEQKALISDL